MTTITRYRVLQQAAYRRRIQATGLPAILAPYTITRPHQLRPALGQRKAPGAQTAA